MANPEKRGPGRPVVYRECGKCGARLGGRQMLAHKCKESQVVEQAERGMWDLYDEETGE